MALARAHMVEGLLPFVLSNPIHKLAAHRSLERKMLLSCNKNLSHPSDVLLAVPSFGMIRQNFRSIRREAIHDNTNPSIVMSLCLYEEPETGYSDKENGLQYKDIPPGIGLTAEKGDQVTFAYQYYDKKSSKFESPVEGNVIRLGDNHKYGQGFNEGICGMKCEGKRRLKIPQHMSPQLDLRRKMKHWSHKPKYEIYDVTLLNVKKPA